MINTVKILLLLLLVTNFACKSKKKILPFETEVYKNSDFSKTSVWERVYLNKWFSNEFIWSEGEFIKDSVHNGMYRVYNPDNHSIDFEYHYKNGKIDGLYRQYYANQNFVKIEGYIHNGNEIGCWKSYDSCGFLKSYNIFDSIGNLKYFACFNGNGRLVSDSPSVLRTNP